MQKKLTSVEQQLQTLSDRDQEVNIGFLFLELVKIILFILEFYYVCRT